MKRIARAVTITGITMGAAVLAAPSAMADIHIYAVDKANIGHNGPTYVAESGPGNLNFSSVTGSPKASPKVGNESVKVDDINTNLKGGKGNTVINEVEGAEQDEGEGAEQAGAGAEQAGAEQAEGAEQASASTLEAQEAAPQQEAAQAEAAQQEAAPTQEAAAQQEAAPTQEAAQAEAAQQEAAPTQEAAAQQEAAEQEEAEEQGAERTGYGHGGKNGHDQVKAGQWIKKSNVGHNGPTLVGESGPGNLNFSSVTGSPFASPKVGNESVTIDDINTNLKGGKGNTVINEVEGSEQDEIAGGYGAQQGAK